MVRKKGKEGGRKLKKNRWEEKRGKGGEED
jgi:hypothetical protein